MPMTILRADQNKQMNHTKATSNYIAQRPEFALALVPTSQFRAPDRASPGSSPRRLTFPSKEDSPFLTFNRQEKDEVLP